MILLLYCPRVFRAVQQYPEELRIGGIFDQDQYQLDTLQVRWKDLRRFYNYCIYDFQIRRNHPNPYLAFTLSGLLTISFEQKKQSSFLVLLYVAGVYKYYHPTEFCKRMLGIPFRYYHSVEKRKILFEIFRENSLQFHLRWFDVIFLSSCRKVLYNAIAHKFPRKQL